MPPLFDATGLFRVHPSGVAERVLSRTPRRARFQVSAGGETSKVPPRAPARPVLHPTRGHVGQNAPRAVMDRLSAPDDPEATVGRFARATRRQSVEFHATVHPLSGRMMSLARGHEHAAAGGLQSHATTTRRRLMGLHDRSSNPAVRERALSALMRQGNLAGPRPIVVHNHPAFAGGATRHMPSGADLPPLITPAARQQNRVVSLVPHAGRGQPKTHETTFGFHHPKDPTSSVGFDQASHIAQVDAETAPPALLAQFRRGRATTLPLERMQHGLTRAQHQQQLRDQVQDHARHVIGVRGTGQFTGDRTTPIGASYDQLIRDATQPGRRGVSRRDFARQGGFYTRENVRKSAAQRKAFGAFTRAARSPGYMLRAHPSGIAAGTVGVAAALAPHHTDRGRKLRDTTIGVIGGKAGYQLAGHSVKSTARRGVQWHTRMSDLPTDTAGQQARKYQIKAEQKMRGRWQRAHEQAGTWNGGAQYRDFPLGMTTGDGKFVPHRGARVFRALGHTHGGRSGVVLSNTAGVAGGVIGYRHAVDRGNRNSVTVHKAATYGFQQTRTRPVRAAEFTAGGAAAAWGLPRLAMTGPLLQQGAKLVERYGGADAAARALKAAQAARGVLTDATRPLAQIRRIERVNHAVEVVPAHLRPAVATVAGALLMGRAHPVRQPTFVPLGSN